jgi:hypothetical protein
MASFTDGNALAIELKSSWIEATNLTRNDYVIIHATVPNFVPDGSSKLVLGNPKVKDVDLALVGFHVVGSMAGHPEMTWATFEHVNNSPNLSYPYVGNTGNSATINRPADAAGPWLFSSKGAQAASIKPRLKLNTVTKTEIVAVDPANPSPTVGPSDVTRLAPWGTISPDINTVLINNTDMVSINATMMSLLPAGDVRRNYIMIGAIWTDGNPPTFDTDPPATNHRGTPTLANSTMETFQPNSNCFGCHSGNMLGTSAGRGLSHIYGQIAPLFPRQP